jgi:hypothetical protein
MSSFYHHTANWEKMVLTELYKEYDSILAVRSIKIKSVVIELTESHSHWGMWIPLTRTIQLSKKLVTTHPWFNVIAILKHEMAHQIVDELYLRNELNDGIKPHGDLFKKACLLIGVPAQFSKFSADLQKFNLDWRTEVRDETTERMLERVRKLLALATSNNENEALLAMNKVREIYAKYNLLEIESNKDKNDFVHLAITNGSKRIEAHEQRILSILITHFFVRVIIGQSYNYKTQLNEKLVEIIGTRANVLMAEYVYNFLKVQVELLTEDALKKSSNERSRMTKKSYRLGILTGFSEKLSLYEEHGLNKTNNGDSNTENKSLMIIKKDPHLGRYISKIYPRLRSTRNTRQSIDKSAFTEGKSMGFKLNLNKPIENRSSKKGFLLK